MLLSVRAEFLRYRMVRYLGDRGVVFEFVEAITDPALALSSVLRSDT
jgi:hypothetical protein